MSCVFIFKIVAYVFFYYLSVVLLKVGLYLSAPFSTRSRRLVAGQRGIFHSIRQFAAQRTESTVDAAQPGAVQPDAAQRQPEDACFWFHCASLGEFEQGRPVIEALKEKYPSARIVLTFFSPSGYEVRHDYAGADLVSYLPLDGWRNARRFVELIRPTVAFFVKYEYWYGYLRALSHRNIPALSLSTLLLPHMTPFRWYGSLHRRMLRRMTHYFVQNTTTAELLKRIDIDRVTLTGDTRFDRAAALCHEAERVELAAAFKADEVVFVVGSSWPHDINVLLPLVREFADELKFMIAPHEIEEAELLRIEAAVPYKTVRYSRAKRETVANYRVMLIDNVGMLTSLYRYGSFAYVGGAFGKSLHNILEPATFGMPIYFGNRSYRHVSEANALLKLGGAFTVADSQELRHKFLIYHRNEEQRKEVAAITRKFVAENTGATDKILQHVEKLLS